ncbi:HEPN domain-containing protein [Curtobacterium flaccumfaciens]|jgi:ApeA N-terminal domain 1|uniref:ApeA N-terminal domain 1-containing protein n=1 Tax=Curtobacterium flaccumfaciens TaxID=2035 RepID=UPI001BDF5243|nr:HEPN domain-containing protein [Curtobacterium flaccumfaciens]MBT1683195.1 reverse gyrase [Curtobacterium flaccumfaciens pv. flaccumfaciens]
MGEGAPLPNELKLGTRRTGDLIDFDPDTPEVKVVLDWSEHGISVEVPWSAPDDYYASWFLRDGLQGLPAVNKPIPKRLMFADTHGALQLVQCWPRGFHSNLASGTGRMWARFAVMDVRDDIDFQHIDGIRSEVSGLREWLRVSSVSEELDPPSKTITVVGKPADEIIVAPNLTFVPTWSTERPDGEDSIVLRDYVACQTMSATPADWDDLAETHHGIRDLLVLARWRPETCTVTMVTRDDDPIVTLDGKEHGRQWRNVVVASREESPAPVSGYRPHLMEYDEIGGASGVARWLELREEFSRALDPIITDRYLQKVPALTHLAQVGPGLEALGYLLLKNRDGVGAEAAKNSQLRQRLDRIAADVDAAVPFDAGTWAETMTRAYNGIKHANRSLPAELDLLNRWRESVVAVRAWVALELGAEAAAVKRRLELDPSAGAFVARD